MLTAHEKRTGVTPFIEKKKPRKKVVGPTYRDLAARFDMALGTLMARLYDGKSLKEALESPIVSASEAGCRGRAKQKETEGSRNAERAREARTWGQTNYPEA